MIKHFANRSLPKFLAAPIKMGNSTKYKQNFPDTKHASAHTSGAGKRLAVGASGIQQNTRRIFPL